MSKTALQPRPWEKDHNPQNFVSTQEWTPRHAGEHIQIRWGRGYESAGIWNGNGYYYLLGPRFREMLGPVKVSHWSRLKFSPSEQSETDREMECAG